MNEKGIKVDLHLDGLLWLINRTTFHPRGYALGHDPETHEFVLYADGSEPWIYDPAVSEDALFQAVEAAFKRTHGIPKPKPNPDGGRRRWWQRW